MDLLPLSIVNTVVSSGMAWVEYQKLGRLIKNEDTFRTMDNYLRKDFLEMLFPDIN